MRVTKCDLCKKIVGRDYVSAEVGFYSSAELCYTCGEPIVKFLKKHKFLEKDKVKKFKI